MVMSTHEFKVNLNKAHITVNVQIVAKHDYVEILIPVQFAKSKHCCKWANVAKLEYVNNLIQYQSYKADIAVNVKIVAKHDCVSILIQVQFTQGTYRCKFTNCGQT